MRGTIIGVHISPGGMPKLPIAEGWAGPLGLEGDRHNHPEFHGGPRKALLLVSQEDLETLKEQGFALVPGSLGENLTVRGMDFRQMREGMRLRAGCALIELTTPRKPCGQLEIYNDGVEGKIQAVLKSRHAFGGHYAAVLQAGAIRTGDPIALIDMAV